MSDGMSEAFGSNNRAQIKKNKKYLVFYVKKNEPKIKKFATLKEANKFVEKINNIDDRMNSWVDYIVYGKILRKLV